MTTRLEKIIVNKDGLEETFPFAQAFDFANRAVNAEELKEKLDITVRGLGSILDTKEATVLEGKMDDGKRASFTAEGLVTDDNPDGELKPYVTAAFIRRGQEVLVRENKFDKNKQTIGLRVTRL